MSTLKYSVTTEYNYDFTNRKEIILDSYFKNTLLAAEKYNNKESIITLIISSNWSKVIDHIEIFIKAISKEINHEGNEDLILDLIIERNQIKKLYLNAFIELDAEFVTYSNQVFEDLERWYKEHRFVYNTEYVIDEFEDYFLRMHNEFVGNNWKVIIYKDKVEMPNGDIIFGITPSDEERVILDTVLYDADNEPYFYDVINIVKSIDKEKIKAIAKLTENFTYNAWVNRSKDFVYKLAKIAELENNEIEKISDAVASLAPEWYGHGEDLLDTIEKLLK